MPKISIIIPVYRTNTSYLAESISSALSAAPKDSELLVGIDGTLSHAGLQLLDSFEGQKSKVPIRILKYKHRGLVMTLNDLIKEADCELVARLDSDDVCQRSRLYEQMKMMDAFRDIGFCGTQVIRCDKDLKILKTQRRYPTRFKVQLLYASLLNNPIAHPTLMIRRSILPKECYRKVRLAEDWDLYIRLWQAGYRSVNLKSTGLFYRTHLSQATKSERSPADLKELKARSLNAAINIDKKFALARPLHNISNALRLTEMGINAKHWLDK